MNNAGKQKKIWPAYRKNMESKILASGGFEEVNKFMPLHRALSLTDRKGNMEPGLN